MTTANARDPAWAGGARGDGVTDDTAAIQAALTALAATGGELILPSGAYRITSTLIVTGNGVRIRGAQAIGTEIKYYGGAAPMIDLGTGTGVNDIQYTDIMLCDFRVRDYGNLATSAIRVRKVTRPILRDVSITFDQTFSTATYSLDFNTTYFGSLRNVQSGGSTNGWNFVGCKGLTILGGAPTGKSQASGIGVTVDSTSDTVDCFAMDVETFATGIQCAGLECRFHAPRFDSIGTSEIILTAAASYCRVLDPSTSRANKEDIVVVDNNPTGHNYIDYLAKKELAYQEFTAAVSATVVAEASAPTVVTAQTIRVNGTTPIMVEFFCPYVIPANSSGNSTILNLWDGATNLGKFGNFGTDSGGGLDIQGGALLRRRIVPSAGTHDYAVKAWSTGVAVGSVGAGAGGSGQYAPGYIRVTRE